jgi:hypothetical protein
MCESCTPRLCPHAVSGIIMVRLTDWYDTNLHIQCYSCGRRVGNPAAWVGLAYVTCPHSSYYCVHSCTDACDSVCNRLCCTAIHKQAQPVTLSLGGGGLTALQALAQPILYASERMHRVSNHKTMPASSAEDRCAASATQLHTDVGVHTMMDHTRRAVNPTLMLLCRCCVSPKHMPTLGATRQARMVRRHGRNLWSL